MVALWCNQRPGARFRFSAPSHDAAERAFDYLSRAVHSSLEAEAVIHVIDHQGTLKHRITGATLRIMSPRTGAITGRKSAGFVLDELPAN